MASSNPIETSEQSAAAATANGSPDGAGLQVQEKREAGPRAEHTHPGRYYTPPADIYETDEALIVVMDVPGVSREQIDVHLERDVLTVEARLDLAKYRELTPVYTEYNVGSYTRRFVVGDTVQGDAVQARLSDGVLTLELPRQAAARPRRIVVA